MTKNQRLVLIFGMIAFILAILTAPSYVSIPREGGAVIKLQYNPKAHSHLAREWNIGEIFVRSVVVIGITGLVFFILKKK